MLGRSRVALRTPTAADEEEFIVRMRASRRLHHPWLYPPLTPDAYRAYLERIDDRAQGRVPRLPARGRGEVGW